MKLFLQKNAKFSSAGGSALRPPASGGFAPRPPKQPPHCEFLATRLRRLRLLTMLLPGRIYIALGPWQFGDFRYIFLPNVGEDHKKS